MKRFEESQYINRYWLFMLILAVMVIVVGTAYYATVDADEGTALVVSIISVAIALPIILALLYLRLETRIDQKGIEVTFRPFRFTRKHFSWNEIKTCRLRKYDPGEFGGWGLRGIGRSWKAYFIYGNQGIDILTKKEHRFLIGTQRPAAAKKIIKHYFQTETKPTHEN